MPFCCTCNILKSECVTNCNFSRTCSNLLSGILLLIFLFFFFFGDFSLPFFWNLRATRLIASTAQVIKRNCCWQKVVRSYSNCVYMYVYTYILVYVFVCLFALIGHSIAVNPVPRNCRLAAKIYLYLQIHTYMFIYIFHIDVYIPVPVFLYFW